MATPMNDLIETFSGIRGIYGKSLTENLAQTYARAYLRWHQEHGRERPKLIIGRDTRSHSKALANAFIGIFVDAGCEVLDLTVSSTPATENAVRHFTCDGGIIVTASHSPSQFNGWKMLRSDGAILSVGDAEKVIEYARAEKVQGASFKVQEKGSVSDKSKENPKAYADFLVSVVGEEAVAKIRERNFNILFDCNGGAIIPIAPAVAEELNVKATYIHDALGKLDPKIEERVALMLERIPRLEDLVKKLESGEEGFVEQIDVLRESLKDSLGKMREIGADFTIGFDTDADRAEIMPQSGDIVTGQYMVAMLVNEMLSSHSDSSSAGVVTNDATSDMVHEIAKQYGAKITEVEVGEINLVDCMKQGNGFVGGEGSSNGGILLPQTCRDGLLTFSIIVRHLAKTGKTVEQVTASFPGFYTLNYNVWTPEISGIRSILQNHFSKDSGAVIQLTGDEFGGLKVRYKDGGWIWYRISRTEPGLLRFYAESKDEARAKELLQHAAIEAHHALS